MDFAINIDKFNLANLVGDVLDKIIEFQIFFTFSKLYLKVKGTNLIVGQPDIWPPNFFMEIPQGPLDMSKKMF